MGRELILAVAGAGKTTKILNDLSPERRSLILTYTNQNLSSLETSLRAKNDGIIPEHVELRTYFSFLYSFCIRPYFSYRLRDNGFVYGSIPRAVQKTDKKEPIHYLSKGRYLYAARAAKLIREKGVLKTVTNRLCRHFDNLYIDEVQDFAANDFNFLLDLAQADISTLYVGDYFQHTFDTSRDGNTRSTLHKKGYDAYVGEFKKVGFDVDTKTLSNSRRCSPEVCSYITDTIGIEIGSGRKDDTSIHFLTDPAAILAVYNDQSTVKLFFRNQSKYDCYSNNWGNSKGLDRYQDVCVVVNPTTKKLLSKGRGRELSPSTKNKFYVACTRARGDLYFVDEDQLKKVLSGKS
jgi:DNA helicase-2/ATP-dependent DNA helicase PcrA